MAICNTRILQCYSNTKRQHTDISQISLFSTGNLVLSIRIYIIITYIRWHIHYQMVFLLFRLLSIFNKKKYPQPTVFFGWSFLEVFNNYRWFSFISSSTFRLFYKQIVVDRFEYAPVKHFPLSSKRVMWYLVHPDETQLSGSAALHNIVRWMLSRAQLRRRKITTDDKNVPPLNRIIRKFKGGQDYLTFNLVFMLKTLAARHSLGRTYWCVGPTAYLIAVSSIL